jgi:hypothetical protein
MEGSLPDLGLFVLPGFFNSAPVSQPEFAQTAGDSGLATSIGQAGSTVSVNGIGNIDILSINDLTLTSNNDVPFASATLALINNGAIAMTTGTTTGTEPMTLTAQGIITIQSEEVATGGVNITTAGGGAVVNIVNAGEIDFDVLGAGALTGVQTINGAVYPPSGSGATTSITQGGALVATLGNGAVYISSIGAGVTADIMNAGTITFDSLGSGALVNLSTINGSAYPPPPGSISSITNGGGYVDVDANGTILAQAFGNAFLALLDSTTVAPDRVTLATGDLTAQIKMDTDTIRIDNPTATTPSQINMDAAGAIQIYATDLLLPNVITGISTINGAAYPPASFIPADITVSSITAANYVSTIALQGVSTINSVAYPPPVVLPASANFSTIGIGASGTIIAADSAAYLEMSFIQSVGGSDLNINAASGNGLFITGGASSGNNSLIALNTNGTTQINNTNTGGLTNGDGISVGGEGISLAFPLDSTSAFGVGAITNISTINGAAYPPPSYVLPADITVSTLTAANYVSTIAVQGVSTINGAVYPPLIAAPKQATYYNSAAQNLTSGDTDITFDLSGAWNNAGGYITHTDGTKDFTVVQTGLYQLEFNASINGSGVAWTGTKFVSIDITRSPTAEQAIIQQSASINSGTSYGQGVSATYYLVANDVINLKVHNVFSSGTPTAIGLTNTIDLGTFFTWRFIS